MQTRSRMSMLVTLLERYDPKKDFQDKSWALVIWEKNFRAQQSQRGLFLNWFGLNRVGFWEMSSLTLLSSKTFFSVTGAQNLSWKDLRGPYLSNKAPNTLVRPLDYILESKTRFGFIWRHFISWDLGNGSTALSKSRREVALITIYSRAVSAMNLLVIIFCLKHLGLSIQKSIYHVMVRPLDFSVDDLEKRLFQNISSRIYKGNENLKLFSFPL